MKSRYADDMLRDVMIRMRSKLFPWLLAAAFLAVQAIAFAHEIEHDLKVHSDASCVLHAYTKHAGHATATICIGVAHTPHASPAVNVSSADGIRPTLGYHTRAPPHSSARSL